jgi:hypothetical protein
MPSAASKFSGWMGLTLALAVAGGAANAPKKPASPKKPAAAKPAPKPAPKAGPKEPQEISLGNLAATVPGEWTSQPPNKEFRLLQFALPKAGGDKEGALMIVFHFGKGGGGTVDDNVKRWQGMMRQPDGKASSERATLRKSEREGVRLTTLDLPGIYLEKPFPFSDEVTQRPDYRLLAAVIETTREDGDGPYFVRLVGPAKTIDAAAAGWKSFTDSIRLP